MVRVIAFFLAALAASVVFSEPPADEATVLIPMRPQRVCYATLPWLISFSLVRLKNE
jgi:hypothetical protein